MTPYFQSEGVTLYHGDCLEVLSSIGIVSAVVTDPPYGIGADKGQQRRANKKHGKALAPSKDYGESDWDSKPASDEAILELLAKAEFQIIFGGNYFSLPPSRCWLVWDKLNGSNDYADCELAWTNLQKAVRRIQFRWHGMLRDEPGERLHPTQKPVGVMAWAMSHLPFSGGIILDPYMGSGTTGVACIQTARDFIGIEAEEKYCEIAAKRIESTVCKAPDQLPFSKPELFAEVS